MIQVAIKSEYIIKVIGLEKPISSFTLLEDGVNIYGISHIEWQNNGNVYFYLKNALQLGKHYQLIVNEECYEVDLTNFVDLDFFDKTYFYDGELGAIYEPNMTSFKLFAPLAYQVNVILYKNKKEEIYPMTRLRCGVFVGQISGDLDNVSYLYEIHQNGKIIRTLDPYSLSVTLNKEYSVVINKNSYTMEKYNLPVMNQYVDAIIYETSIRDLTTYAKSPIKHKGTYYGFVEENRKYRDVPIGIDLLKFLNITHVQVLPINAFFGIDENNVQKQYNWGYNPILYMALEGSYSINPASPQMRIKEFKFLVSTLHKAGIRINIDVVFNHIYKYETSIYQQIVPNYYFRHNASSFSNGSFVATI